VIDPQAQRYLAARAALNLTPLELLTPEEARASVEAAAPGMFGSVEAVSSVEDREVGGVPARVYDPGPSRALPTVVYFHGGGFVTASVDTHDGACRELANRSECRVVSVGYRLAPEHPFPAAVEDCWAATRWALDQGGPVAVAGDSAGGGLAAVMASRARDAGRALACQVLIYPVVDHDLGTGSYASKATGYGLTREAMRWYWAHYLGGADGAHPEASPLRAPSLAGVAPALVVVCEHDPLRDEGVAYAERLRAASVPVRLSEYLGMIHGFVRMAAWTERTHDLIDECAATLRDAFAEGQGRHR
jgi:acetyl esterase